MAPFHYLISVWIKFFFLFTPFFALSMFLTMTRGRTDPERRRLAWRVTAATGLLCLILFFFGNAIFALFGITLDAFRVGAGALLFISAVGLAGVAQPPAAPQEHEDIVVVPLAMPVIIGPATIGTLLVLGVEASGWTHKLLGCIALRFPNQELKWDNEKHQFSNFPEANAWLTAKRRAGYDLSF